MAHYNCVAYKCFVDVYKDVDGVDGKENTLMLATVCVEGVLRAQPFALDDVDGTLTTGSLKHLIATVEASGRPLTPKPPATGAEAGAGSDGAGAAALPHAATGSGDVIMMMEAKVKGWVKELGTAVKAWEVQEKKDMEADTARKAWRASLRGGEAMVLIERLVYNEEHSEALKQLDALAPSFVKHRDAVVSMCKARIALSQYLHQVNSSPDLPKLLKSLETLAALWQAAAALAEKEGAGGAGGVCRAAVCLLKHGHAREEVKHLSNIYAAGGGKGKQAGEDQAATDQANLDEVAGLLKQRGVFGTPSLEETIKEMEEEYHDNVRFGLSDAAETVSNLLEWYRDYRTRLKRGGDMYAKKDTGPPKEDPVILQALQDAK